MVLRYKGVRCQAEEFAVTEWAMEGGTLLDFELRIAFSKLHVRNMIRIIAL